MLILNTVAVSRNAPHPEAAQRLFEYLQRPRVVDQLVAAKALEGASATEVSFPTLKVDWEALLTDLEGSTKNLNQMFLR